ncbi:hypothetical protein [Corynebacterium gottingense]|uniref:hypothetical protein n=1 Tax=Corynebacterium gottingense TaxID=2041036 RepID=UPI0011C4719A|nr:hypothetical protein [Corynebacterium gottingense]WJZ13616.1 hypothetical protein CGOTT_08510 [Corynebacterium gottingense]WJZ15934.1 hypothetical protein CGOTTB_08475 [Corynebacterium gottingense]
MIYSPNRVVLPDTGNFKRVPPRKPADRQSNYLERFDFDTIFSDVFIQDGRVWMIGPPFLNLESELRASTFKWNWVDVSPDVKFENLNRMSRASFPVSFDNGILEIEGSLGYWRLDVDTPPVRQYENANILVTQQQDNRLEWIAYWAFYNAQVNGVNAVVLYDNCSENYSPEMLDQVLSRVPGIEHHIVVRWDTPFGATGGPNNVWDSDFGQHISWEHCRRSFASGARTVCVIDIDELPICPNGEKLSEKLTASTKPALHFKRQPIRQYANRVSCVDLRAHECFSLGETRGAWLATKFIYSPNRIPDDAQLLVHRIRGIEQDAEPEEEVFAGHFDGIRVRWRRDEKQPIPLFKNREDIVESAEPVDSFDTVFDDLAGQWNSLSHDLMKFFERQKNS